MDSLGLVAIAVVGLGLGWLIWRLATMKTDPEGYSTVASYTDENHVSRAERVLEAAGVPYRLDDHSTQYTYRGRGTDIRLLVPNNRRAEAASLLRSAATKPQDPSGEADHDAPPA